MEINWAWRTTLVALVIVLGGCAPLMDRLNDLTNRRANEVDTSTQMATNFTYLSWQAHSQEMAPCPIKTHVDLYTGRTVRDNPNEPFGGLCPQDVATLRWGVFDSTGEASAFELGCATTTCTDWLMRPATADELVAGVLGNHGWKLEQKYPPLWEVENGMGEQTIAIGRSQVEAVTSALVLDHLDWHLRLLFSSNTAKMPDQWAIMSSDGRTILTAESEFKAVQAALEKAREISREGLGPAQK